MKALKILHVLSALDRGGVETWLLHLAKAVERAEMHIEICLLGSAERQSAYEEEFRRLNVPVHRCPLSKNLWRFSRNFCGLLKQGQYDVVHSHLAQFSGYVLYLARKERVSTRIAHSHNDLRQRDSRVSRARQLYLDIQRWLIRKYATAGLACSRVAAESLFGSHWSSDSRWQIMHYGIDLTPFSLPVSRDRVRDSIGLPNDAVAFVNVGGFRKQKNHPFLLRVFQSVSAANPKAYLVLLGDGSERPVIEKLIDELGLQNSVLLLGSRNNVIELIRVMDVFFFPSLHEGYPIALIEAQAAGLPCVISANISPEVIASWDRVKQLSLAEPIEVWRDVLLVAAAQPCNETNTANIIGIEANIRTLNEVCRSSDSKTTPG